MSTQIDTAIEEIAKTEDDLGQLLRHKREAAGLTRDALGLSCGVHRNTLERWERGKGLTSLAQFILALERCGVEIKISTPQRVRGQVAKD